MLKHLLIQRVFLVAVAITGLVLLFLFFTPFKNQPNSIFEPVLVAVDEKAYSCNEDADCISVSSGCCGCGGQATAINKYYVCV